MDIAIIIVLVLALLFFFSPIILLLQLVWGLTKLAFRTIRIILTGALKTIAFIFERVERKQPTSCPPPDPSQEQT